MGKDAVICRPDQRAHRCNNRSSYLTWLPGSHIAQSLNSLSMLRQVVPSQTKQLILRASPLA